MTKRKNNTKSSYNRGLIKTEYEEQSLNNVPRLVRKWRENYPNGFRSLSPRKNQYNQYK